MFWLVINKSCQRQTNGGLELNVSNANTQLPAPSPPPSSGRTEHGSKGSRTGNVKNEV